MTTAIDKEQLRSSPHPDPLPKGQGIHHGVSLAVIGCGGNIGSHLLGHLGRMASLDSITLVDRDVYEAKNLSSQDITPRDVGRPKALVQATRLRRINPRLRVHAIVDSVENVPLGWLRADVVLTGLDSRGARQWVNECVWRLGIPWIDAGVEPGGLLARVTVYQPGPDAPCLECLWDNHSYALVSQAYPCTGDRSDPPPTNAPSSLGALAAALQAIECRKLVEGPRAQAAIGQEIVVDAAHHRQFLTTLRRSPACRFDHDVWCVERTLRPALSLRRAARLAHTGNGARPLLRVQGRLFALGSSCACGAPPLRLVSASNIRCDRCGQVLPAAGADLRADLDVAALPAPVQLRSLRDIGIRRGDLFSLSTADANHHFEVA